MKKILGSLIFSLFMVLAANGQSFNVDGIYYSVLEDVESQCAVTYSAVDDTPYSGSVAVPESVTYDSKTYRVTRVNPYAFSNSDELLEVTLPASIESIGRNAFSNCASLTSVVLSENLQAIPEYVFLGCVVLETVSIPASVTEIADYAFSRCISLSEIELPDGVSHIGDGAFSQCNSLKQIVIPDGIEYLGSQAFEDCYQLDSIIIPSNITIIEPYLCSGCKNLTSLELPANLEIIGTGAFKSCAALSSVQLPTSLKLISDRAFELCTALHEVDFQSDNLKIDEYAFAGCSFVNIDFSGVTEIGTAAFSNNSALSTIIFPETVKRIENRAFDNCNAVTNVYCYAMTPPTLAKTAFENSIFQQATLYLVNGNKLIYAQTPPWNLFIKMEDTLLDSYVDSIEDSYLDLRVENNTIVLSGLTAPSYYAVYTLGGVLTKEGIISPGEAIDGFEKGSLYILNVNGRVWKLAF